MAAIDLDTTRALEHAHESLRADLDALEAALDPAAGEPAAMIALRLAATRTLVDEHFRSEEQDGYMDVVRDHDVRLEAAIDRLVRQHRELYRTLEDLVRRSTVAEETVGKCGAAHRKEIRDWIARLRGHEREEQAVFLEAFNRDIGSED